MGEVVRFCSLDRKVSELYDAVQDAINTAGEGMSYASVIGTLEIIKHQLLLDQLEDF